ncbi:MAG: hypothetical protein LAT82_05935 [Nanoarchaeota archaeon]|nr:hypothetical protein [Nanoarchaeota archaeon]
MSQISQFQHYLEQANIQVNSYLELIKQENIELELEQCSDIEEKQVCELYQFNASKPIVYIFSSSKYIQEIEEHRFKHLLSTSAKTFKLMQAIKNAKEKHNTIKLTISQIIQELDLHSIQEKHNYISHLLSLSYYFNWDLEKKSNEVDTQSYLLAPHSFMNILNERYNLTNILALYEDESICIYLNSKHELICFFKVQNNFTKKDIELKILPALKEILALKLVTIK